MGGQFLQDPLGCQNCCQFWHSKRPYPTSWSLPTSFISIGGCGFANMDSLSHP